MKRASLSIRQSLVIEVDMINESVAMGAAKDRWRMAMCDKLWNSQIQEVIEACVILEAHPRAGDAAYQAATYYHNNQHRMD